MKPTHVNRLRVAPSYLVTHRGFAVLSAGRDGLITSGAQGFYLHQTRFLSRFEIKAKDLQMVSANTTDPHAAIGYMLLPSPAGPAGAPPGDEEHDGGEIVAKAIEIRSNAYVGGGLHWDFTITNRSLAPASIALDLAIDADFADMDEALTGKRLQSAPVERRWNAGQQGAGQLQLDYKHPQLNHGTLVEIASTGDITVQGPDLRFSFELEPRVPHTISVDVVPLFLGTAHRPWYGVGGEPADGAEAEAVTEAWRRGCASVEDAPAMVQNAWDRAAEDLASLQMLDGEGAERWVPIAGVPKYSALFGRDTLVTGAQTTLLNPAMLEGSLRRVGRWTAKTYDDTYDAQPGKVLHQHQLSPLALLGINPYRHYYGDYSAPGLFVLGAALHFAQTADREMFGAVRSEVEATLAWMDRDGDIDGDGFYEYLTRAPKGTKNQGWKDSGQAILYPDGAMVQDPIAIVEVQGLYYAAKQAIALVYRFLGEAGRAADLLGEAAALKQRFNRRFWLPESNYYALALDPDKKPVATVGSDPGTCLAYGIIDADKAAAVAERLLRPDMFSGWGIRTLSTEHPAYNPLAYHLGTIWPMPNATICYGLWRYGLTQPASNSPWPSSNRPRSSISIACRKCSAATRGIGSTRIPGIYPDACSPQAWSAGAMIQNVQTLLGLTPLAPLDAMILDPVLPEWLPTLTLRDLTLGQRRVTLRFERDSAGASHCEVLAGGDGLRVHRAPPRTAGAPPSDRIAEALRAIGT